MFAIATILPNQHRNHGFSLRPYRITTDFLGEESVIIYSLTPWFKPLFPNILNHLATKHSNLIYTENLGTKHTLPPTQLYPRLEQIFTLMNTGTPKRVAILCTNEEEKLPFLLNLLSPFAYSVSLVTDNTPVPKQTETILQTALENYGLTVTQRTINQLGEVDLILLVSGQFDLAFLHRGNLINLSEQPVSASIPMLTDITTTETSAFLAKHPELFLKHVCLLPKNARISRLIWQYC